MRIQDLGNTLSGSFDGVWTGVAKVVPSLLAAIIIFIVGWIVAALIGKLVAQLLRVLKVDTALQQAGFEGVVKRAGFNLNSGAFVGGLVRWFVVVVFLVASFEILGLSRVNDFLQDVVLNYLPQVIVAVLILLVAVVIAEAMQKVVVGSAKAAEIRSANFLGSMTKWAIWIFAVLVALVQLGIAVTFINTLFTGVVVALSIAFGLSFGLGGQDAAREYVNKMRQEIASHHHHE